MTSFRIAGRPIGPDHPPFIIAELSGNHNGDIGRALSLIEAAKDAGADAIKFQTYTPDTMTIDSAKDDFVIKGGLWHGRRLYELYGEAQTPWEWHATMFAKAREIGLIAFSTPFDHTAVDFLEGFDVPAYKIASFELIDLPLVERIACTRKPIIISTGMASFDEIAEMLDCAKKAGCEQIILLHCISAYPAPVEQMNLRMITEIGRRFATLVGLSDHTLNNVASIAAVATGACAIEKHMILARSDGGPDAEFSLEPHEFASLCEDVRAAWIALGRVMADRAPSEAGNKVFRRSLYVVEPVAKGEVFTIKNVRSIRPGFGMAPKLLPQVIGRRANRTIERGTALTPKLIADWPPPSALRHEAT